MMPHTVHFRGLCESQIRRMDMFKEAYMGASSLLQRRFPATKREQAGSVKPVYLLLSIAGYAKATQRCVGLFKFIYSTLLGLCFCDRKADG